MNLREAAQQALDELIAADGMPICNETDILDLSKTIETLRAALAEDAMQRLTDEQQMIERGTKAWAAVQDATDWVEEMRGNVPATSQESRQVEPVAYLTGYSKGYATVQLVDPCWLMCVGMALYRSPYKYKPLTDEEIEQLMKWPEKGTDLLAFARAIEQAHGLGGEE